jgi:YD repeat-containing protein
VVEWTYDTIAKGQPTAATRFTGGQAYTQAVTAYDHDYRSTGSKVTIPASEGALAGEYVFGTAYDAAGNVRSQSLPAAGGLPAETLTHAYTDLSLVKSLASDLGSGFTYLKDTTFTPTGKLATRLLGADGQIKRTLERDVDTDWLSRITTQTEADSVTPDTVHDDQFGYDLAGKITSILDTPSGQAECFTYDGLRRLSAAWTTTGVSCAGGSADGLGLDPYNQAYAYDRVGNVTALTDNGQTSTYTYPALQQVRQRRVDHVHRPQ